MLICISEDRNLHSDAIDPQTHTLSLFFTFLWKKNAMQWDVLDINFDSDDGDYITRCMTFECIQFFFTMQFNDIENIAHRNQLGKLVIHTLYVFLFHLFDHVRAFYAER